MELIFTTDQQNLTCFNLPHIQLNLALLNLTIFNQT